MRGLRWFMGVMLFVACKSGDDDDAGTIGGSESSGSQSSTGSTTSTSGTTATTSTTATTGTSSASTSGDSGSDDATTGMPVACGDLECAGDQVCVVPCCGGPSPAC